MLTIKDVIQVLRNAKQDAEVQFDFGGIYPTTVASWRGIYAEPALGWQSDAGNAPKVSDLLNELCKAIDGREYTGWKGGEYSYREDSFLHIDNPGRWTSTELVRVEDCDYCVILHTRRED